VKGRGRERGRKEVARRLQVDRWNSVSSGEEKKGEGWKGGM